VEDTGFEPVTYRLPEGQKCRWKAT